ncbi:hypothetical protein Aph01nite_42290 [Acrocarpospora phusangensis]|uniref:Condensation domain-containing protein n=1 Tax=Acrocarpospora phusangensis TaxID=1070424 RepID=A0A919QB57_9ACTN|nr:condensation domain-containing protein [Acrocarpospora phusangensis]GIH25919.1 hypothetical protein Aph01nite_42290 [Acrocarpospora phusangensis]
MTPEDRAELVKRLAELPPERREALRRSLAEQADGMAWPLSSGQERLWFLSRFDPDDTGYHMMWHVRLHGAVDHAGLVWAFSRIVARHEVLRTRFLLRSDRPAQVVRDPETVPVERIAGGGQDAVVAFVNRPFDLSRDLPIRVALIGDGDAHLLCMVIHHIAGDAWSLDVLMRELAECYAAYQEGREPALPPLTLQYRHFAVWERKRQDPRALEWWAEWLAGVPPLDLPVDRPRPKRWSGQAVRAYVSVPDDAATRLEDLAKQERCTPFMALVVAFQAGMGLLAGQEDFAVGVPVHGRDRPEFATLIGCFSNTIAVRADLSGDPTFRELLRRARGPFLRALQNSGTPFERVLNAVQPPRDLSRPPLCQVVFNLTHDLPKADLFRTTLGDLRVETCEPLRVTQARAEVLGEIYRDSSGVGGWLEYNSDLFSAETGHLIGETFTGLVHRAGKHPDLRLSHLKGM